VVDVVTADSVVIVDDLAASPHAPTPVSASSTIQHVFPVNGPVAVVPVIVVSPPAATFHVKYRETLADVSENAVVHPEPVIVKAPVFLSPARTKTIRFPAVAPAANVAVFVTDVNVVDVPAIC
jgi:hypothetical protein